MSDKMSELRSLVERLTWTVSGEPLQAADLVELGLSRFHLVITTALIESEGTVSDSMCGVQDGFPFESPRSSPGTFAGISSSQPLILLLWTLCSCFVLASVVKLPFLPFFGSSVRWYSSSFDFVRLSSRKLLFSSTSSSLLLH